MKIVNAGVSSRKGRERGLSSLLAGYSLIVAYFQKGLEKNSSLEEDGINVLCPLIGLCVAKSLGWSIDSWEKIDLWLLQVYWFQRKDEANISRICFFQKKLLPLQWRFIKTQRHIIPLWNIYNRYDDLKGAT